MRELIQTVDFESRIDYGLRDLPALTARIARLEALVTEYEMGTERDDGVLTEVFDSMSMSILELGRLDDAATGGGTNNVVLGALAINTNDTVGLPGDEVAAHAIDVTVF